MIACVKDTTGSAISFRPLTRNRQFFVAQPMGSWTSLFEVRICSLRPVAATLSTQQASGIPFVNRGSTLIQHLTSCNQL